MHGSVLGFFAYGALQGREVASRDVLEVGSLDVNGSVRAMVEARGPASYTGIDVAAGPGVDRVADVEELWKHWDQPSFDVVVCTETMEHVGDWRRALASMVSVLRPGGVLIVTTRSPGFAYHHPPDRWRYTQQAFAAICEALGLEPMVLMDDPEYPGVFWKVRKPESWDWPTLLGQQAGADLGAQIRQRDRHGFADIAAGRAQPAQAGQDDKQAGVVVGAVSQQPFAGVPHAASIARLLDGISGVTPMVEPYTWLGLPCQPDGTGYYRFWQPWTQLARRSGHTALIPPPGQHDFTPDDDQVEQCDLLAAQRPNGPKTVRAWQRWKGTTPLVYEADDNILEPDPSGLPNWLETELRETTLDCLRLADLVTCSTDPLAEVFRRYNPNVTVIGNHVHADLLSMERAAGNPGRVTVGWAGGLTHLQDIALLQQPLKELRRTTSGYDLHFLGQDYRPLFSQEGRFTPWQTNVWDYYRAIDFDIGVVPLADTAFNRCRTPIKALEYAALGIPVLASDVEPYRGFVVDGVTGYLCRTETDWRSRLRELINDPEARAELGAKAREVAADHTIQTGWQRWADAYEAVCSQ